MAKRMKDYQIFKCPYCSCEFYDSTAKKGRKVGDPMLECPACGKKSYRSSVLEPAIIGGKRFFDVKFSSLYGNLRIGLILIYAVFLFIILVTKDIALSISMVLAALILYLLYEVVRIAHRSSFLRSDEYDLEITRSLERLADGDYARMIIKAQGLEEDSVYYYELYREDDIL